MYLFAKKKFMGGMVNLDITQPARMTRPENTFPVNSALVLPNTDKMYYLMNEFWY